MHVLQLGPYPPPEGGINRNILAIRRELHAAGHRCSVIATSKSTAPSNEPDVYHPLGPLGLLWLLVKLEYDILHLHVGGDISARVMLLVFVCSLFGRGRNLLSFHSGGYPFTDEGKSASPPSVRGWVFRRFSRIIAVNPLIAEVFERYGVEKSRLRVIYPFVHLLPDPEIAVPCDIAKFAAKSQPFLLTVGLLEDEYDLFMQIDAFEDVLRRFPDAGLAIVGSGSLSEGLAEAIKRKPYADKILLTGDVEHGVTLHLINDAHILLRTTLFDGDAISVREALFLGTPVIATDNEMRPEGVHLIPKHDEAALVTAIGEIASQTRRTSSPVEADTSNIIQIVELYDELAARRGRGRNRTRLATS